MKRALKIKIKLTSLIALLCLIFSITAKAGLEEGISAFEIGDFATAKQELLPLADKGNPAAQVILGVMYAKGEGVAQDAKQAVYLFQKAAEQGYAQAQHNLGLMYNNGEGVAHDDKQAAYWYQKAADQGHAPAQYNLGLMYYKGDGVTHDAKQAAYWFQKAADQGNAEAIALLR